ncbi:MAG: RNA polymerase sigma factor FliA [Gammaproteobacteria bacterium]|nr:RNA polymerase sigma factor FliA [Gammaproteobacteria bacterium]MBP6052165.1 RNA polymerase sigma factor FliA [Pseudomonadales bacterium]MBK6582227.1 RNA polymerase sigma factor FliA [Gammaproteobacteria bacterium]MBK7521500.1 RNA polymerase sigma factor FliA [Gammaproteobacteria bacterium]MBK7729275.1 RNA polymerase sigma factor FliA [Gammaproteobacteria bacterium]
MYASATEKPDSRKLVEEHGPLVRRIAYHLLARLPSSVNVDDLVQSGMIGLLEAAANYDAAKGASFETYAGIRIRGAMIDEVRRGDWSPRSVHRNARRVAEVIRAIETRTGEDAADSVVARELGISLDEYHGMLQDTAGSRLFSLEELIDTEGGAERSLGSTADNPADATARLRLAQDIGSEIERLPERERLVLSLYYDEELNLKEIGLVLQVSESRVSQILSQATKRLRARLGNW